MKKRLGKFYMSTEVVMGHTEEACEVFSRLSFVPLRCEHFVMYRKFEMIGFSPLFELCSEGMVAPEYRIIVSREEEEDNLKVTVEKITEIDQSQLSCEWR